MFSGEKSFLCLEIKNLDKGVRNNRIFLIYKTVELFMIYFRRAPIFTRKYAKQEIVFNAVVNKKLDLV